MTPEWMALEGKIVREPRAVGATGSAAVPLALDHAWRTGAAEAGRQGDAAGDRDEQVEVCWNGRGVDRRRERGGRSAGCQRRRRGMTDAS